MQITRMNHEKLLAAIDREKEETAGWRRSAEVASKRVLELGKELEAKADLKADLEAATGKVSDLYAKVARREITIVHQAMRLAEHGDADARWMAGLPHGTPPLAEMED